MNEFIVWDEAKKEFLNREQAIVCNGEIFDHIVALEMGIENKNAKALWSIGKIDIEGNKIYADCSIVEFTVADYKTKDIGYFTYDSDYASYLVKNSRGITLKYSKKFIRNLKVIGTLQEDKHLLGDSDE